MSGENCRLVYIKKREIAVYKSTMLSYQTVVKVNIIMFIIIIYLMYFLFTFFKMRHSDSVPPNQFIIIIECVSIKSIKIYS